MKSSKLFTLLLLFVTTLSFSQDLVSIQTLTGGKVNTAYNTDLSDKTIQGSPYVIDEFMPARVTADIEKIFNLRYNAVSDQMEVKTDKNTIQAINKNIKGVKITFLKDSKTYEAVNYINEDGIAERGYFININSTESKVKLLLKELKKYIPMQPAKSGYSESKPAYFKRADDVYYVVIKNKTAQVLPEKKKELLKLFPENADDISTYIKKNKIRTSRSEDLIKLIDYINTL
jgi:hypothetical protein